MSIRLGQILRLFSKPVTQVILVIVLFTSLVIQGYSATFSTEIVNKFSRNATSSVELLKCERDQAGNTTDIPIPATEFFLYMKSGQPDQADIQIGGRYVTDAEGKILVTDLSYGEYYFLETNPAPGYSYDSDLEGEDVFIYPFEVTEANSLIHIYAFNKRQAGSLNIKKTLINDDGSDLTASQKLTEFAFQVNFNDGGRYKYRIDGSALIELSDNGILLLKPGQLAVFTDVPLGVQYSVVEVNQKGYVIESRNHQGNVVDSGTEVEFINTASLRYGSLTIEKTIAQAELPLDEESELALQLFEFEVSFTGLPELPTMITVDGQPVEISALDNVIAVLLRHGELAHITGLPVGTSYQVREKDTESGYLALPQSYSGQIIADLVVTKEVIVDGVIIDEIVSEGVVLPFVNALVDEEASDYGSLKVSKKVIDASGVLSTEQTEQLYDFIVVFDIIETDSFEIIIDGLPAIFSVEQTEHRFQLRHDESLLFEMLPRYIGYSVHEIHADGSDDYIAVVEAIEGKIMPDQTIEAIIVNYIEAIPEPAFTTLIIEKVVDSLFINENCIECDIEDKDRLFDFILQITGWEPVEFSLRAGESIEFSNLPVGQYYAVFEKDCYADGFALTEVLGGSGTLNLATSYAFFTNTCFREPIVEITGTKTWDLNGYQADIPESITVLLMSGVTVIESLQVTPDSEGVWAYYFSVPKLDSQGNEITYWIDEVDVFGFAKSIDGFNITNTCIEDQTIIIKGYKAWDLQGYDIRLPESITVFLLADGRIVDHIEVRPDEAGIWSFSFEALKYNSDGRQIVYSIDEADVLGFTKMIRGLNITNVFKPPNPGENTTPQTADNEAIFLSQLAVSLLAGGLLLITLWYQWRPIIRYRMCPTCRSRMN
ncbi:MAG: Cna B-type domain-containing protein [Coriobacteriales bacterium]|nr:Cna B-type domain-containing protein [Coriobacteriales bacterium]